MSNFIELNGTHGSVYLINVSKIESVVKDEDGDCTVFVSGDNLDGGISVKESYAKIKEKIEACKRLDIAAMLLAGGFDDEPMHAAYGLMLAHENFKE